MKIITSGDDSVSIINAENGSVQWDFPVQESKDLSPDERAWVNWYSSKTDECKPIDNGDRILVTSVSGLVCIIAPDTGSLVKLAWVPGAHSAERISESLFAVAVSLHPAYPPGAPQMTGNYIALFDINEPCRELARDACKSAHGVVWEQDTETLWALGFETIRSYIISSDPPGLIQTGSYPLPDLNGHDLAPVPGKRELYVSTGRHVYTFRMESGTFEIHPDMGNCISAKSISHHPRTDEVIYVGADPGKVKSDTIRFAGQDKTIARPGTYKARWL